MTAAHTQKQTLRVLEYFPAHEPREDDPHYHSFEEARRRLKKAGRLVCWRCGATERIELHHAVIEFALANGVDLGRFEEAYPEFGVDSEEAFLAWCESENNLLALCTDCHRGLHGIHSLPYPLWIAGRVWRQDLPPAGEVLPR